MFPFVPTHPAVNLKSAQKLDIVENDQHRSESQFSNI